MLSSLLLTLPNIAEPAFWVSILTLTFLEIVLGIDNIIFISIIADKLPREHEQKARNIGLLLAMIIRIILLFGISWIVNATHPLFTLPFLTDHDGQPLGISIKDLILFAGGIFLIAKSTSEIHGKLEGEEHATTSATGVDVATASMTSVIVQISLINLVFSFDSILTAVGLTKDIFVMLASIIASMVVMMLFAGAVSRFINKHPTLQMLALSFLILIGVMLVLEGFHQHVPKGYIYFSIAFSLLVEILNMRLRRKQVPVQMRGVQEAAQEEGVLEKM